MSKYMPTCAQKIWGEKKESSVLFWAVSKGGEKEMSGLKKKKIRNPRAYTKFAPKTIKKIQTEPRK